MVDITKFIRNIVGSGSKFDIGTFRSHLDDFGGPARPSLFRVQINLPGFLNRSNITTRSLTFFCQSTTLPGVRLASKQVQRYGIGPLEKMPIGFEFDDLSLTFIADADGNILNFFKDWTRSIVEYSSEGVPGSIPSNRNPGMNSMPYYVNYKNTYQTQVDIITYAPDSTEGYAVSLLGAFPVDIGDVVLNWGAQDQIMLIPVRFSFIDSAWTGNPSSAGGFISNVASVLTGVADTVKTVTNVTNSISKLF